MKGPVPTMSSLSRIFVIGDSISMHYGPHLEAMLAGRFSYARKTGTEPELLALPNPDAANGGDSGQVLAYLQAMFAGGGIPADLLLLNCGLHDLKTDRQTGTKQVPLEAFCRNLPAILALLQPRIPQIVWASITPVDEASHNTTKPFNRYQGDVGAYNAAATAIMRAAGVPVADLYAFTVNAGTDLCPDGVHFNDGMRVRQAAFLAGFLQGLRQ